MSYTDRVLSMLTARPGEWFDAYSLMRVAGAMAWRTRVSEARRRLQAAGQGDIINTQIKLADGKTQSLYRYQPAEAPGQRELFT